MSNLATTEVRPLTDREYNQFRKLAYDKFGLDLREGKQTLVAARLGKKMRELNIGSFEAYYQHVQDDGSGEALISLIDALTTNHTSFFREPAHFEFLRQTIIPTLRTREHIAIWSAACSTGEEPYTIAFSLIDELGNAALSKVRILATDISTKVLASAQTATYPAHRLEGMPADLLRRCVLRGEGRYEDWYRVKKEVRAMVEFRRLNLMDDSLRAGPFPVIFCRNVMIYFDKPTQQEVVRRLAACLEPGGYLLIGHAESLNGIDHSLQYVRPAVYRRPDSSGSSRGRR